MDFFEKWKNVEKSPETRPGCPNTSPVRFWALQTRTEGAVGDRPVQWPVGHKMVKIGKKWIFGKNDDYERAARKYHPDDAMGPLCSILPPEALRITEGAVGDRLRQMAPIDKNGPVTVKIGGFG